MDILELGDDRPRHADHGFAGRIRYEMKVEFLHKPKIVLGITRKTQPVAAFFPQSPHDMHRHMLKERNFSPLREKQHNYFRPSRYLVYPRFSQPPPGFRQPRFPPLIPRALGIDREVMGKSPFPWGYVAIPKIHSHPLSFTTLIRDSNKM